MRRIICFAAAVYMFGSVFSSHQNLEYNYEKQGEDWNKKYADCAGKRQSPINIETEKVVENWSVGDNWWIAPASNTKTISFQKTQMLLSEGKFSEIHWKNTKNHEIKYIGTNIHYHTTAEHAIDGVLGDAEVHFVHKAEGTGIPADSQFIALGLIFKQTPAKVKSNFLAKWGPNGEGKTVDFNMNDALQDILTQGRGFYTYTGSLTTPPCTEVVRFFILDIFLDLDDAQLANLNEKFKAASTQSSNKANNRKLHDLNGRMVSHITFDHSVLGPAINIADRRVVI